MMNEQTPIDRQSADVVRFPTTSMDAASAREGDPVHNAIERLTWDAYVAAIDAHDYHQTASTQHSRNAALLAWRRVFLVDKHEEARP